MENGADPVKMAYLDLHCLLRRIYAGSAGQGLKTTTKYTCIL